MLRSISWALITVFVLWAPAQAAQFRVFKENDEKRAVIRNSRSTAIFYEKLSWNEQITQVESGYLYLRDRRTGEIYEISVAETEPNSGVFSAAIDKGSFRTKVVEAEVYSVPKTMLEGKDRLQVVKGLLKQGALKRKPFLLRVLRAKGQMIDVFDDKEAALASYQKYRKLLGLDPDAKVKKNDSIIELSRQQPVKKKIIDTNTLQSLFLANKAGRETENLKNKELRDVLREIEVKRRRAVKNNGKAWGPATRQANEKKAASSVKQAFGAVKSKNFAESRKYFREASDLVPSSEVAYQQYGVALFREDKYNQSIVVLELAQTGQAKVAERYFYMGMNYYKLNDYEMAELYFKKVVATKDPKLAPTAAFYLGTVQQELEKFDESKESFQYVLDNSKNPEMDKRAEQFIESGIKKKAIAEKRSHRWFYDGVIGTFYDSNIILAVGNTSPTAQAPDQNTDIDGFRFLFSNKLKYRALYTEKHELGIRAAATLLQSTTKSLETSDTLTPADPWVFSVDLPWNYRGTLWKKGYTFELSPKYETIYMDLSNDSKKAIIDSVGVAMTNKLVINPKWVAVANYEIRKDNANEGGGLSDDADAFKIVADFSSIIVLNRDEERYLIPQMSYTRNDANGAAFGFTRVDISAAFTNALFEKFVWTNKVGYFIANYESDRIDKNYNFTSGLAYALGAHWNMGLNLNYQINDSNTNKFNKFQAITTFSFSY